MMKEAAELIRQAVVEHQANRLSEAEKLYRQALACDPACADAYHLLGVLAIQSKDLSTAIPLIKRAIVLDANQPEYFANLGVALERSQEFAAAVEAYASALRIKPDFVQAIFNQAIVRLRLGQNDQARQLLEESVRIDPTLFDGHLNLGAVLMGQGELEEAKVRYLQALSLQPSNVHASLNLGNVYFLLREYANARHAYQRAIALDNSNAFAFKHLALVERVEGAFESAMDAVRQSIAIAPNEPESLALMIDLRLQLHDWTNLRAIQRKLESVLEVRFRRQESMVVSPLTLLQLPEPISQSMQLACARSWADSIRQETTVRKQEGRNEPHRRMRIGYLSADLRDHPVGVLLAGLIESHNRAKFEIYGYSIGPKDDSNVRKRLIQAFEHYFDIESLSYREAAEKIANDQIDILVDLQGYTEQARTQIMAMRPAPAQVSYLGYPGTMGADFIDYLIADEYVVPPGADALYDEKIVRLPGCYLCNDPLRFAVVPECTRSEHGLPDDAFIFCGFSSPKKLTESMFKLWLRLLHQVPNSYLWLRSTSSIADSRLQAIAAECKIAQDRIVFAPHATTDVHLARQRLADLFLDTFPYNQHSTAQDALSLGLPILTLSGESFASRVAGSLLSMLGLTELITSSFTEYEERALKLACNPSELHAIRARLTSSETHRKLIDSQTKARHLEDAFARIDRETSAKFSTVSRPGTTISSSTYQEKHQTSQPMAREQERKASDESQLQLARKLHAQDRFEEAERWYRHVLSERPNDPEAHHFLGILLSQTGRGTEGAASIQRAIHEQPTNAIYYFNLGVVLENLGEEASAVQAWLYAIQLDPDYLVAWEELSRIYMRRNQWMHAKQALTHVLRITPGRLDKFCDFADACDSLNEHDLAKRYYRQILVVDPRYTRALNNLANILRSEFELKESASLYQRAIESDPQAPFAYFNLANVYTLMDRGEDAIHAFEQVLQLTPDNVDAWLGIGSIWMRLLRYRDALPCFQRAYQLAPHRADVTVRLVQWFQQTCSWEQLSELNRQLLQRIQEPSWPQSKEMVPPLVLLAIDPEVGGGLQRFVAEQHSSAVAASIAVAPESLPKRQAKFTQVLKTRRLRIGYLSADFRNHPVGMLIVGVLEKHDRSLLEVFAYSFGPDDGSVFRRRIEQAADHFIDMESWSFQRSIEQIRRDEIDIMIDLQGLTGDNRPEILAARPAPIQILYLGYVGTSGAPWIDYVIGDEYVIPAEARSYFREKVIYLSGCYMVADSKRTDNLLSLASDDERRQARLRAGLPEVGCVLCGFSAPHKITPRVFHVWLEVLRQVPDTVLWLRIESADAIANLRREAVTLSIAPERLVFAPKVSMEEHLVRHQLADLFLDTFPYNQHSTAGDALRMGLPLVTISGSTMASRVAGSFLAELGLADLITCDYASYQAKILELARAPEKLGQVRQRLKESLSHSTLFDGQANARKLEKLLQQIWFEQSSPDS